MFIPEGYEGFSDCVCLHATYNSKFKTLTHSDLLGCLMHSGIERSVIGDLIVQEDDLYIFCKEKISKYIIDNCTQIGKCTVHFEVCLDYEIIKIINKKYVLCAAVYV